MGTKIYVGNLAFSSTESSISALFSEHGTVDTCRLITDRETGKSKGFGFVEMSSPEEAATAISNLNGKELDGRALKVNEARPKLATSTGEMSVSPSSDSGSGFGSSRGGRRSSY